MRFPLRLGPIGRSGSEVAGVGALVLAALSLAFAGVVVGGGSGVLLFPAFGIPYLLLAGFRWRRFRLPARWSTDVKATVLLAGLTVYLAVSAAWKGLLAGVVAAVVLGASAAAIWLVRAFRDRPR